MASLRLHRLRHATGAALAAATIGLSLFTAPHATASSSDAELPPVVSEGATSTPEQVRDFWTPERLKTALANPLDTPAAGATPVHRENNTSPGTDTQVMSADAVPPKDGNESPTGQEAVATTASAPTVSRSQRVSNSVFGPTRAAGKLVFETPNGTYNCSASVIASKTKNAVWTAAHCLHGGKGKGFYKNFVFFPGYQAGLTPYHWWFNSRVIVPSKWSSFSDLYASDMGAIVVEKDLARGNLEDAVGAFGYNFGAWPGHTDVHSYGYPFDGYNRPDSDFGNGEYLMYCRGNTVDGGPWDLTDERLRMNCDMGHGSSGGPMVTGVASGNIQIVGVNSHRNVNSSGNWSDNYMFSSQHSTEARSVLNSVNG